MDKGMLAIGGITIVVIGVIVGVAFMNPANKPQVGQSYPIQSRDHIEVGASHAQYNSNPPTSGWHYAEPAKWGIFTETQPDENLIHNLEHGGIWISYNPSKTNKDTIDKLTQLAKGYSSKVILEPRPANDKAIALASWGRLTQLDSFDEAKIKEFIARNKNKGPEQVPDM